MAEPEEPVKRRVALRSSNWEWIRAAVIARFERRQALAGVEDHPHIAKVLGRPFDRNRPAFFVRNCARRQGNDYCDQNNLSTRGRRGLFVKSAGRFSMRTRRGSSIATSSRRNSAVTVNDGVAGAQGDRFRHRQSHARTDDRPHTLKRSEQFIGHPCLMSPEKASDDEPDIDTRATFTAWA